MRKHGRHHIETLWYCLFLDRKTISEFALLLSSMYNIVGDKINGKKVWANCIPENGFDGVPKGIKCKSPSDASRLKNSLSHIGKQTYNTHPTVETIAKI